MFCAIPIYYIKILNYMKIVLHILLHNEKYLIKSPFCSTMDCVTHAMINITFNFHFWNPLGNPTNHLSFSCAISICTRFFKILSFRRQNLGFEIFAFLIKIWWKTSKYAQCWVKNPKISKSRFCHRQLKLFKSHKIHFSYIYFPVFDCVCTFLPLR